MKAEIHYDLGWDDYRGVAAMNPSTLKHGLRSMLRLKRAIDGECQPKQATVAVGSAVHCMIAGEFDERFAVMPDFHTDAENCTATGNPSVSKATAYYKERAETWRGENTKDELTQVQSATAAKIANRLRNQFADLFDSSQQEVALVGEIAGVEMKTRLDGLQVEGKAATVWDIKVTNDASDFAFYRTYRNFSYGFAAAVHTELLAQNGLEVKHYYYLVAENGADYDVRKIELPLEEIARQDDMLIRTAEDFGNCIKTGYWPGLGPGVLALPAWDSPSPEIDWEDDNGKS